MSKALRALFVLTTLPVAAAAQGRLGSEFRVNFYTPGNQTTPAVAPTVNGGFVVVWTSYGQDGSDGGVFARRVNASGVPVGADIPVNSYTTGRQTAAAVASDAAGNFVVVWTSPHDGDSSGVFAQRFNAAGVPQNTEFRVNTYTTGSQGSPDVDLDPNGNFIVVWGGAGTTDTNGLFGRRYGPTGSPIDAEFALNSNTPGGQQRAAVVLDDTGAFTAVWETNANALALDIMAREFGPSGGPLGAEFRLNTYTTDNQWFPSVAWRPNGGFTALWNSSGQEGPRGIYFRAFFAGGVPWNQEEFRVNLLTAGSHFIPSVAADAQGNFAVVWFADNHDGNNRGVALQYYVYPGIRGPQFVVNSYTFGAQEYPDVAMDANGNFMVVWGSSSQDGDSGGIFAQRFSPERIFADGFE